MNGKKLIVGDIHGCYDELQMLIDKAGLSETDQIIALGDIVDRGPNSPEVLDFFFTQNNSTTLLGNHERKHLRSYQGLCKAAKSQLMTRYQLGENSYAHSIAFMKRLPLYIELHEAILVHGFLEPNLEFDSQKEVVLTGAMSGEAYLIKKYDRLWYELYDGMTPVVFMVVS